MLWSGVCAFVVRAEKAARNGAARGSVLDIEDRLSLKNSKRPRRPHTDYIVLHTTEGEEAGSLHKVQQYGETHYLIGESGRVYRVIDKNRIAAHAGRSMWQGHSTIDNYSVGIEVVGYHDRDITEAQYAALRELLHQLKDTYHISDRNVLTHSMVAYGRPNRFHPNNHRGRKRCGMIFARPDVRARLGLDARPEHDFDVEAGRLKVGDPELYSFLFVRTHHGRPEPGRTAAAAPAAPAAPSASNVITKDTSAWQIARERYDDHGTIYVLPDGRKVHGDEIKDWSQIRAGTRVHLTETAEESQGFEGFLEVPKDGTTSRELAGDDLESSSTIYFFPDGLIRTGKELRRRSMRRFLEHPPSGTRVLVGYVYGGYVRSRRPPSSIAGEKWNYPSTFYRLPDGTMISGDGVDASSIPAGTLLFYQN